MTSPLDEVPSTKTSVRRSATRHRIRAATAAELLVVREQGALTVSRICERAGLTRGGFYSNYRAIDDVLTELLVERCTSIETSIREWAEHSSADAAIRLRELVAIIDADRLWFALCAWACARPRRPAHHHLDAAISRLAAHIADVFDARMQRVAPPRMRMSAESAARLVIVTITGHHATRLLDNGLISDEAIATALSAAIFADEIPPFEG